MRRAVLAACAILLAVAGQWSFSSGGSVFDGILLFAAGAVIFALCLPPHRDPDASPVLVPRRGALRLVLVLVGAAVALNALALVLFFHPATVDTGKGWPVFFASVLLLLGAAWLYDGPRVSASAFSAWWSAYRWELLAVLSLTAVALFLRLFRLDELPFGTWFDEADYALAAIRLADDPSYRPLMVRLTGEVAVLPYAMAAVFQVLGESTWAARTISACVGAATIPAAYLLGRQFFGVPASLALAGMLAFSRWHLNFSRIAMHPIMTPFVAILAFCCLIRGLRSGRVYWHVLSAFFFACGLWFYAGSRFTVIAAVIYLALLLALSAGRRRMAIATGICAVAAAGTLFYSPGLAYMVHNPEEALVRTRTTSIFRDKSGAEAIAALAENTKKHLLMFHYRGDPNGRHNLPGEPMLDPVVGVLAVLGLGTALRGQRRSGLMFVNLLFVPLLGGILTLEFEAPQSLRSIGSITGAYLLAALAVDRLARGLGPWNSGAKREAGLIALTVAATVCAFLNVDGYFRRQANDFAVWASFSTADTLVAHEMNRYAGQYPLYLSPHFRGHPTVRFLAPAVTEYREFGVSQAPLVDDVEGAVILLDSGREAAFVEAQRYYPDATFRELRHPESSHAVAYEIVVSPDDVARILGVEARYYVGTEATGDPALSRREHTLGVDWETLPLGEGPVTATWSGTLRVPEYGEYVLGIDSPGEARVLLNGEETLGGGQPIERNLVLAEGNYSLEVTATVERLAGRTELYWQRAGEAREVVLARALFVSPVTANGLLGTYYRSPDWSGPVAFQRVDPGLNFYFHVTPLPRPYSVEWQGRIYIPVPGAYRFGTHSIDFSWVYIDGNLVVDNSQAINQYAEGTVALSEGFHDIRVRFQDMSNYSHIDLYWTPPGGERDVVPVEYLFPPGGPVPAEALPSGLPGGTGRDPASVPTGDLTVAEPVEMRMVHDLRETADGAEALNRPRDIAVDAEGNIYVVDEGNRRVVVYDANGEYVREVPAGEAGPHEPVGVVVTPAGDVLVLDAEQGLIFRYGPDGASRGHFGGTSTGFYRPRGIAVDGDGNVYVADTGRERVVCLGPDGAMKWQLGGSPESKGLVYQPTDVVVDHEGAISVIDPELERLRRFSPSLELVAEWIIGQANTIDGPHLALGPDGSLFLTDPEAKIVLRIDRDTGRASVLGGEGGSLLSHPVGIYVDAQERVYVADVGRHSVLVLER